MKVLFLTYEFFPKWGGIQRMTYDIGQQLIKNGHQVDVIATKPKNLDEYEDMDGINIHRIYTKFSKIPLMNIPMNVHYIVKKIKEINPDVVHVQGLTKCLPAIICKKKLDIPFVLHAHGKDVYNRTHIENVIAKIGLKKADEIIALTDEMKEKLQALVKCEPVVIGNGIDYFRFNNKIKKKIDKQTVKILYVGRLEPVKNVESLIKAMRWVKFPRKELYIIGDGSEKDRLKDVINENQNDIGIGEKVNINMLGNLSDEKTQKYMDECEVFVLPSDKEGQGIVLLEAMANGMPIVASNVNGVPSIIEDGENGILVENKDMYIAMAISELINDPYKFEVISMNNIHKAKDYDWSIKYHDFVNIYNRLIDDRK